MRSSLVTLLAASETEQSGYGLVAYLVFAVLIGSAFVALFMAFLKR